MPRFILPASDPKRLAFLTTAADRAWIDRLAGRAYLPECTLDDLEDLGERFSAACQAIQVHLTARMAAVDRAEQAFDQLKRHLRDLWATVRRRVERQRETVRVLGYYQLCGSRNPNPPARQEWIDLARAVIVGEAQAISDGYAPVTSPTIAEVQAALDEVQDALLALQQAERAYQRSQQAVAELRPAVHWLARRVMAELKASLYQLDRPGFRRIARSYGAQYQAIQAEQEAEFGEAQVLEANGVDCL